MTLMVCGWLRLGSETKKNLSRAPLSSSGSSLHYRGGNGSLTSVGMWIVDWGGERAEGLGVVGGVGEGVGEEEARVHRWHAAYHREPEGVKKSAHTGLRWEHGPKFRYGSSSPFKYT